MYLQIRRTWSLVSRGIHRYKKIRGLIMNKDNEDIEDEDVEESKVTEEIIRIIKGTGLDKKEKKEVIIINFIKR